MKKHRHRILGAVFFVLYLVLLTYFLFFAEEMGAQPRCEGRIFLQPDPF